MFIKSILQFLFLTFFSLSATASSNFHPEADTTLKSGKAWVQTTFNQGATNGQITFRAWIPFETKEIWQIMIQTNNYKHWHSDYKDSKTISKKTFEKITATKPQTIEVLENLLGNQTLNDMHGRKVGGVWNSYTYQRFNFPWPLKDRWVLVQVKNDESASKKKRYVYTYKMTTGTLKSLHGYWELIPHPDRAGWSEWRGEYKMDPGIDVPQFLTKTITRNSIRKTVKTYTDLLMKKEKS